MKTKLKYKTRVSFSKHFQKFQNGEIVAVIKKPSVTASFPGRLHGQTGVIDGKVGKAYVVRINGKKRDKKFLVMPIHLNKINANPIETK